MDLFLSESGAFFCKANAAALAGCKAFASSPNSCVTAADLLAIFSACRTVNVWRWAAGPELAEWASPTAELKAVKAEWMLARAAGDYETADQLRTLLRKAEADSKSAQAQIAYEHQLAVPAAAAVTATGSTATHVTPQISSAPLQRWILKAAKTPAPGCGGGGGGGVGQSGIGQERRFWQLKWSPPLAVVSQGRSSDVPAGRCDDGNGGRGALHDEVLKAIRVHKAAWRAWLAAAGLLEDPGPDPGRHAPAARLQFYHQLSAPATSTAAAAAAADTNQFDGPGGFVQRCGLNCVCCAPPRSTSMVVGADSDDGTRQTWGGPMPRWG